MAEPIGESNGADLHRLRREPPLRTAPTRNRMVRLDPARGGGVAGTVVEQGVHAAYRAVEVADATLRGTVERGVETAYAVIDEYMTRGREAAGGYHQRMGDGQMDRNQTGGPWGAAWGPAMNPMMAPWVNMMYLWAQTMGAFTQPFAGSPATPWGPPNPCAPTAGVSPAISVQVKSDKPAEVSVQLDPGTDQMTLAADPLNLAPAGGDAGVAPLGSTAFDSKPGHVRFRIAIPATQPDGTYTGNVHDTAGIVRGRVSVIITSISAA